MQISNEIVYLSESFVYFDISTYFIYKNIKASVTIYFKGNASPNYNLSCHINLL